MYLAPAYYAETGVVHHNVHVGIHTAYITQSTKYPEYTEGTLTLIPITLNVGGSVRLTRRLSAKADMGIGYFMAQRDINTRLSGWKQWEDVEDREGYTIGGGLSYKLNKRVHIQLDIKLLSFNTKLHIKRKNTSTLLEYGSNFTETHAVDLGGILGTMGLKF